MPVTSRLRLPAVDAEGRRIGSVILEYAGELPPSLAVRFVARRRKTQETGDGRQETGEQELGEQETEGTGDGELETGDVAPDPVASYPVLKRSWCGQPFVFLGDVPEGEPPPELGAAARTFTRQGSGRMVVLGAWDGRYVVPLFQNLQGAAYVFAVDPVFAIRQDQPAGAVPASKVLQTCDENVRRNMPEQVVWHACAGDAGQLGEQLDPQDLDLVVVAGDLAADDAQGIAAIWKRHLRPGGAILGLTSPRQARDQDDLTVGLAEAGLEVRWNPRGTVWRARPVSSPSS